MALPVDHMERRQREKGAALAEIALAIHGIETERQNPDHWERVHLVRAFASVFSGCYGLAFTEAKLAMTSPAQRLSLIHI